MPAQIQRRRSSLLKTWHIATLAPGFDASRLDFPIRVVSSAFRSRFEEAEECS